MQFNTTTLMAEQLSIGIGGLFWITLILLNITHPHYYFSSLEDFLKLISLQNLLFLFPIVYLMGILIDRICDKLLKSLSNKLRKQYFPTTENFYKARNIIYLSNCSIKTLFEYNRSRIRICRGWIFNSLMIALFLPFYAYRSKLVSVPITVALEILFCLLAILCYFSWKDYFKEELNALKIQAPEIIKIENWSNEVCC